MASTLEGRVFARLQRFAGLPTDLQDDAKQFQAHVQQDKQKLFQIHHTALVRSVYSVKGKALVDAVVQWLQARDAPPAPVDGATAGAAAPVPAETPATEAPDATPASTASAAPPASTTSTAAASVSEEVRERARQISEALVLSGFLTPYKDDEKHLNAALPEHYMRDNDLFIPVAKDVTELKTTSVWSVADGASSTSFVKRKAGVLAPFTQGKDVYVVFSDATKTAYLFESDLARAPIAAVAGDNVFVQFDTTHFEFGVRVALRSGDDKEKPEIFNAGSKNGQDAFLNLWLNAGATYRETFHLDAEAAQSIYELKDVDIHNNEVSMETYRGKVLLVVNVSSKCGLTPTNYPELAELDRKYRDQGLAILAFPCNQFANQEPGTHEEILAFVKQYECEFAFFEKHDVNGAHARPVFTYLKAKLPGSFGNFVKWNFTKFLVDRNGQPYKRYAPKDLPLSFEDEIVKLLSTPAAAAAAAVEELPAAAEPEPVAEAAPVSASEPAAGAKTPSESAAAQVAPAAT